MRRSLLGIAAASVLVFGACGSDDDGGSADTTAGPEVTEAPVESGAPVETGRMQPALASVTNNKTRVMNPPAPIKPRCDCQVL